MSTPRSLLIQAVSLSMYLPQLNMYSKKADGTFEKVEVHQTHSSRRLYFHYYEPPGDAVYLICGGFLAADGWTPWLTWTVGDMEQCAFGIKGWCTPKEPKLCWAGTGGNRYALLPAGNWVQTARTAIYGRDIRDVVSTTQIHHWNIGRAVPKSILEAPNRRNFASTWKPK